MRQQPRAHAPAPRSTPARAPAGRRLIDTDPDDPSQVLDDAERLGALPLAIDAQPAAEAAADLAAATASTRAAESDESDDSDADDEVAMPGPDASTKETGELYGVRTPHAGDPDLSAPEHLDSFDGAIRGEHVFEAIAEHATESGPAPEEEVVIVDDSDPDAGHHSTERGDPPVADKGSGGPGGL